MKEIKLTQGKIALVDDSDYEHLNQFIWFAVKSANTTYAMRRTWDRVTKKGKSVFMHRELLGLTSPKIFTDHKDRNGLNNQRCNLREATNSQNIANTLPSKKSSSKYKGVSFDSQTKKWRVSIKKNGKTIDRGRFKNEEDAAIAYNKAATEFHGEFAYLNKVA